VLTGAGRTGGRGFAAKAWARLLAGLSFFFLMEFQGKTATLGVTRGCIAVAPPVPSITLEISP
jgi:hypothetical protein